MKRLFIAIKVIPTVHTLKTYYSLIAGFKEDRVRWVAPEKMHLTLKFIGETPEGNIEKIMRLMNDTLSKVKSFAFDLKGVGVFGSAYDPKVLWFKIEDNQELLQLGNLILDRFETIGFKKGRQNFVPHLTICRIKQIKHMRSFQQRIDPFLDCSLQTVVVDKIYLMESILKPAGPEYHTMGFVDLI